MLKLSGNEIWRDGEKAGWIEGNHVFARDGKKLGWAEDNYVYGEDAKKLAYIEGDALISYGSEEKVPLDNINEAIEGGIMPEILKCAVYVLLGG